MAKSRRATGDEDLYGDDGAPMMPQEFVAKDEGGSREMDVKEGGKGPTRDDPEAEMADEIESGAETSGRSEEEEEAVDRMEDGDGGGADDYYEDYVADGVGGEEEDRPQFDNGDVEDYDGRLARYEDGDDVGRDDEETDHGDVEDEEDERPASYKDVGRGDDESEEEERRKEDDDGDIEDIFDDKRLEEFFVQRFV